MFYVVILITMLAYTKGYTKLQDGVLVTRIQDVRSVNAYYTLVVTIDKPLWPRVLTEKIAIIKQTIHRGRSALTHVQQNNLYKRLEIPFVFWNNTTPLRTKRGAINFVGDGLHTLFGVATDDMVNNVARVVNNVIQRQDDVIKHANEMMITVNHTLKEI